MYTHVTESLPSELSAACWLCSGAIVFPNVEKDVQDYWGFTMSLLLSVEVYAIHVGVHITHCRGYWLLPYSVHLLLPLISPVTYWMMCTRAGKCRDTRTQQTQQ